MLDVGQLRKLVVRPVLAVLGLANEGLNSQAAEELLLGTTVYEATIAGDTYLRQVPAGPALGIYQMEPSTYDWLNNDVLYRFRYTGIRERVHSFCARPGEVKELIWNLAAATAYARLRYWVVPEPLPAADDILGLARYWDRHYQTVVDELQPRRWARMYQQFVRPSAPR